MHWTIYAIGSAVFAALVAIFGKIGLKGVDSTLATTVRSVVMAIFLILVSLSFGKFSGLNSVLGSRTLTFIILSGVAGALSWLCYFVAIKEGPVSGVVALDRLSVVFAIALSAIFLSEALTWKTILGSTAIFGGALLIAL
jgi:transporter family protein